MRPMPGQNPQKGMGPLRGGLLFIARRRDPSLRPAKPHGPHWVHHPFRALGLWLLRLGLRLAFLPVRSVVRRKPGAPFGAAILLWLIAGALHWVPNAWGTLAALAFIGAPAIWQLSGGHFGRFTRRRIVLLTRVRVALVGGYTSGCLLAAGEALYGQPGRMLLLLLCWALVAGLASSWWQKNVEVPAAVMDQVDERLGRFADRIAAQGKRLAGSFMTDLEEIPNGWSATIDLSGTDLETADVLRAGSFIAARFGLPPTSVVVAPHLSGRNDLAHLMVFTTNPLQSVQKFKGLTFNRETGMVQVGVHADGRPAMWQFYVPGWGACHALIFGTSGAGKSGLLNVLFTEARHSGVIATGFGDPEQGESSPEFQENVQVFAGTVPRIVAMLQGYERIMDDRKKRRARTKWVDSLGRSRRGGGGFTPTPDDPLHLVVLDEFPQLAKDSVWGKEILRIVGKLLKRGRKWGIAVILLTQIPSLDEMGDDQAIRSMASGMNIAAFRTSDKMSGMMGLPMSLPIDPVELPAKWPDGSITAGLGYLVRSDAAASPMRASFVEDPIHWATTGEPAGIPEHELAVAGEFFTCWFDLMDEDDETAIGIRGGMIVKGGDGSSMPMQVSQATPSDPTIGARAVEYLRENPAATVRAIADAIQAKPQSVRLALQRRRDNQGDVREEEPGTGLWEFCGDRKPVGASA